MFSLKNTITLFLCLFTNLLFAQTNPGKNKIQQMFTGNITPRMRVIIDNDFGGDPDGLFELVQFLLSPSVDIRVIIGSHLPINEFSKGKQTAAASKQKVEEILHLMNLGKKFSVYEGSNYPLNNDATPQQTTAAKAIIEEAMRNDKLPLYVVCGAGLTDLASAYLMEPKIAKRLTLIWIGGPQYPGMNTASVEANKMEYNTSIDLKAAQVVFNKSSIPIWQIPRTTYSQVMLPYSSFVTKVKTEGRLGEYLFNSIDSIRHLIKKFGINPGETYVLGDSPLVLLTALTSTFGQDPSSSQFIYKISPFINDKGFYSPNKNGRKIRVYTQLDSRLIFEDLFSKLQLFNKTENGTP